MKPFYLFLSILFMLSSCSKSDHAADEGTDEYQIANGYYYWSTEQKIPLWPDDSYHLVQLKAGHKASDLDSPFKEQIVVAAEDRFILDKANFNAFTQAYKQLIEKAIPTYKMKDGYSLRPTGDIVIKLKAGVKLAQVLLIVDKQAVLENENELMDDVYELRVNDITQTLKVGNKIKESGLVEFSHPDFFADIVLN